MLKKRSVNTDSSNDNDYVKVSCERVEELPDGGKVYVYIIGGQENKFSVPPEGFVPLTATDEQLMTYGFPPRPSENNTEDYKDWVKLMKNYKSTPVPEIELLKDSAKENDSNSISVLTTESQTVAGYGSDVEKNIIFILSCRWILFSRQYFLLRKAALRNSF